jgi:fatty acid amide hydrolase
MSIVMGNERLGALFGVSASALARRIASRDLTSSEVVEAHIERIAAVNPQLNALVVERYEAARAEAAAADRYLAHGGIPGPLHGVPVTIKEVLDLAGTASTAGLPKRANTLALADDPYVARLRSAGAIVLGKTNVAQLLMAFESENPLYGRTNNPHDLSRSPGGSSGGESAIIAAGGSPLGLGTDIAGSVRNPAAFTGIAALKPTTGRTPDVGRLSIPAGQQAIPSQVGVLARRVADLALGLEVINSGRNSLLEPLLPLGDYTTVELRGLRVAFYSDDGTFTVSPAVRRAVHEAAGILRERGATVTEWTPPAAAEALGIFFGIMAADGAQGMKRLAAQDPLVPSMRTLLQRMSAPRPVVSAIRALLHATGQRSSTLLLRNVGYHDTDHYWQLVEAQRDYQVRFQAALDTTAGGPFDLIICPAAALPALPHGTGAGPVATMGAYTLLYNLLGYPAGVVPVTHVRPAEETERTNLRDDVERAARLIELGSAGLPIGVQVVARPWQEHIALAAMQAIEDVIPPV